MWTICSPTTIMATMSEDLNPNYDPTLDEPQWLSVVEAARHSGVSDSTLLNGARRMEEEGSFLVRRRAPKWNNRRKTDYKGDIRIHIAGLTELEERREEWDKLAKETRSAASAESNRNRSREVRESLAAKARAQRERIKGEDHPRTFFFDDDVRLIRKRYEAGDGNISSLAREYDVSRQCIQSIVKHRTWKHVS